jgi:hypothetical protein
VSIGEVDVIMTCHEHGDLVRLVWIDLMICGLRGSALRHCGNCDGEAKKKREEHATHTSSVIGFDRWMQYNSWRIHKQTPIE